ncbi:MAG: hypothetical protein NT048_03020 [Flavobacterium sp.]|nr:hypothetical protein [Flavobacterium sp.]
MRKIKQFTIALTLLVMLGCSTNNDTNGNSTTTVVPIVPSNLIGVVASTTQINLSWTDHSTNETSFKIERKTVSGTYAVIGTTATDVTTFSDMGLTPSTTYIYRVYSNNAVGNSLTYSNELTLTTSATILLPTLTTTAASGITNTTAITGGTISSDGGSAVTAKGVVWSTSANPTIALPTKTSNGAGIGAFTSSIVGLTGNTTYYIRAYATNSIGTAYGNQVSFITNPVNLPILTTTIATGITTVTGSSGGIVTSDGGASVTARGVVWSTSSNPTIALPTKTINGTGIGTFTSAISALSAATTYYVRAYATNSAGTSYGNQVILTTLTSSSTNVTDVDGNIYSLVTIGNQIWTTTNLEVTRYRNGDIIPYVGDQTQWSNISTGAWSNNNGPVYGRLYNGNAVKDPRGLAPVGFHIPTDAEWTILGNYLGANASGKMREAGTAHWESPNDGATNESGFTGLPGSYRILNGQYPTLSNGGYWWSSSTGVYGGLYTGLSIRFIGASSTQLGTNINSFNAGLSVRCIKD